MIKNKGPMMNDDNQCYHCEAIGYDGMKHADVYVYGVDEDEARAHLAMCSLDRYANLRVREDDRDGQ
jgi:hypothetical protein